MPLLDQIRTQTRSEHVALEEQLSFLTGNLSLRQYVALLKQMYGFYQPWETSVRPWRSNLFGLDAELREKTGLLNRDLLFHNVEVVSIPLCENTPAIETIEDALGSMYVMEGATLGGQIISRNIERCLHLRNAQGYEFFASYGTSVGEMWREFRCTFLAHAADCDENELIESARASFSSMRHWFQQSGRG